MTCEPDHPLTAEVPFGLTLAFGAAGIRLLKRCALAHLLAVAISGAVAASPQFEVRDVFGRLLNQRAIQLVDWEGQMANPAIKLFVRPPPGTSFPAQATLTANGARLYFDLPSETGAGGPTKTVTFTNNVALPVRLSIFPDRDGVDEDYQLSIRLVGAALSTIVPIHVQDQDRAWTNLFQIHIDFSQDKTGFFNDPSKRQVVQQAADDWAYFIDEMNLAEVPKGTERTWIWNTNGYVTGGHTLNTGAYTGFLLYAYGIHTPQHTSGGAPSHDGGHQASRGVELPLKRSGEYAAEIHGNYNSLGWFLTGNDEDWLQSGNGYVEPNDLYTVAHHEIGHALAFNPSYALFGAAKKNGRLEAPTLRAYHHAVLVVDPTDHFPGSVDDASRRGAFGNEFHGDMPARRWLVTKLDLLCLQAVGYRLRPTSALLPLSLSNTNLPEATVGAVFQHKLRAQGGIPFYCWDVRSGALPTGMTLNSFTGALEGRPITPGSFSFTVRVREYDPAASSILAALTLIVKP